MTLAQRVRDCRYAQGWGPDELAARAAISRTALYQIECGKTELPRAATLRRIAQALDLSVENLIGPVLNLTEKPAAPAPGLDPREHSVGLPGAGGSPRLSPDPSGPRIAIGPEERFAVEFRGDDPAADEMGRTRDQMLFWKLHRVLASPLGEGLARIVEESYRIIAPTPPGD